MPVRTDPKKYYNERCGSYAAGSDERGYCEGYVDQCVTEFDASGGDRSQPIYKLEAADGKSVSKLNFNGCLGMAAMFALSGAPKGGEPRPKAEPAARKCSGNRDQKAKNEKPAEGASTSSSAEFSCDQLVMTPPPLMDSFIDEDHDKMSCSYRKFEDKRMVTYSGFINKCSVARRFDEEIDKIEKDYNERVCKLTREFIGRSQKLSKPDKKAKCQLNVNGASFFGFSDDVCEPFKKSIDLELERDAKMDAKYREKENYIRHNFKRD